MSILDGSVMVFALCCLAIILNQNIQKTIIGWFILIFTFMSAIAMFVNNEIYTTAFNAFGVGASVIMLYITVKLYRHYGGFWV